jgi:hypothetical protein
MIGLGMPELFANKFEDGVFYMSKATEFLMISGRQLLVRRGRLCELE